MSFTVPLRIDIDWQSADESVRAPELRATFARVEMHVGDDVVTLIEDPITGSVRRSIVVSLYPLAEWIVFNWWRMQYDGRPSLSYPRGTSPSHNMAFAGDGFCWPDMHAVPQGELVRIQWRRRRSLVGWPLNLLAEGTAFASRPQVVSVYEATVEAVLGRLRESGVTDTVLEKEWTALRTLDADEAEFCRAVARLGVDPFGDGVDLANEIHAVLAAVGEDLAADLFDAASVPLLRADAEWLRTALAGLRTRSDRRPPESTLDRLRSTVRPLAQRATGRPPWDVGWEAARHVREVLDLGPKDPFPEGEGHSVSISDLDDRGIVGAGIDSGIVLTRSMGDRSLRFAQGRALWHSISTSSSTPFLLTKSTSMSQVIGRSFAAELLVPTAGLQVEELDDDEIARISDHYSASEQVVVHQIENQVSQLC